MSAAYISIMKTCDRFSELFLFLEHDNAIDNENNHLNDQNTLLPDSLNNQLDNSMCSEPEPMQTDESSSCSSSPSSSSAENSEKK